MTLAEVFVLLQMAVSLLIAVQAPNTPPQLRVSAINMAYSAINVANVRILEETQRVSRVQTQNSTLGVAPVEKPLQQSEKPVIIPSMEPVEDKSEVLVETRGPYNNHTAEAPYGEYSILVRVKDKDGKFVKDAPVNIAAQDNGMGLGDTGTRYTNGAMTPEDKEWHAYFGYKPTSPGAKNIQLSSNSLSKTVILEVK